jgi:hypothetical protein
MGRTAVISFAAGVALALAAERLVAHGGHRPVSAPADDQISTVLRRLDDQEKMLALVVERSFATAQAAAACPGTAQAVAAAPPAAPATPPRDEVTAQPETPEAAAAFDDGQRLIRDATSAGRWTEHDRLELRAVFGRMSPASQSAVMRQFAVAVNRDQLKLDHPGPPF